MLYGDELIGFYLKLEKHGQKNIIYVVYTHYLYFVNFQLSRVISDCVPLLITAVMTGG